MTWLNSIKNLWNQRPVVPYAAKEPSKAQIANANRILTFSNSPYWKEYEIYLSAKLGGAMEGAFVALKQGNHDAMITAVARANALYESITEPYSAETIIAKSRQIIIPNPASASRD